MNSLTIPLYKIVVVATILMAMAKFSFAVQSYSRIFLLDNPPYDQELLEKSDRDYQRLGTAVSGWSIVTMFLFFIELGRRKRKLIARGMTGYKFGPGLTTWGFLIPFACFVFPASAARETLQASKGITDWESRPASIVTIWWTVFLLSVFLGIMTGLSAKAATTVSAFKTSCIFATIASSCGVISAGFFAYIMRQISEAYIHQFNTNS